MSKRTKIILISIAVSVGVILLCVVSYFGFYSEVNALDKEREETHEKLNQMTKHADEFIRAKKEELERGK